MSVLIFIAIATLVCVAILIGASLAEQAMTERSRRQAEQQRLINERWQALKAREELHQLFWHARDQLRNEVVRERDERPMTIDCEEEKD